MLSVAVAINSLSRAGQACDLCMSITRIHMQQRVCGYSCCCSRWRAAAYVSYEAEPAQQAGSREQAQSGSLTEVKSVVSQSLVTAATEARSYLSRRCVLAAEHKLTCSPWQVWCRPT